MWGWGKKIEKFKLICHHFLMFLPNFILYFLISLLNWNLYWIVLLVSKMKWRHIFSTIFNWLWRSLLPLYNFNATNIFFVFLRGFINRNPSQIWIQIKRWVTEVIFYLDSDSSGACIVKVSQKCEKCVIGKTYLSHNRKLRLKICF